MKMSKFCFSVIAISMLSWICLPSFAMPDKPDSFVSQVVLGADSALVQNDFTVNSVESLSERINSQHFTVDTALLTVTVIDNVGVSLFAEGVLGKSASPILNISFGHTVTGKFTGDDITMESKSNISLHNETDKFTVALPKLEMVQITYRNCTDSTV